MHKGARNTHIRGEIIYRLKNVSIKKSEQNHLFGKDLFHQRKMVDR